MRETKGIGHRAIKKIALICALLPFGLGVQRPSQASAPWYTEEEVINRSNWVMTVDCTKVKGFMNKGYMEFHPFTLYPVIQMRVSYVKSSRSEEFSPLLYEDLWYHNGQPIGLKRYRTFQFKRVEPGTIYVKPGAEAAQNTIALANAIVRLSVDIVTNGGTPSTVLVPEELHQQLLTDFGTYGFHKRMPRSGEQASVKLVANPRVFDDILYYDRPDQ